MTNPPAVERILYAIPPQGEGVAVRFGVGQPVQKPTGEWSASVSLDGLEAATTIFGEDGWQAVGLGMAFIAMRVSDYEKRGWRFYWSEAGEQATAEDFRGG